ncbi:HEXXH motif domain-containing protein [Streptomyces sp. NPDC001920]
MQPTTRRHALSSVSFDELLSGGGSPGTVAALRTSERSWRLLVVRALLDTASSVPTGPLPPLADGWQLLSRARAVDENIVERLLTYPAVGVWAAHTLRRLRGAAEDDAPLWVDTGHLHAIAACAAIHAGLEFRTTVPVRQGWAVLPSLGAMRVPGPVRWATAEVAADADGVRIAGRHLAGPDWHALARLRADGCTLLLDDSDPYRTLRRPTSAEPLDRPECWQEVFEEAWEIVRGTGCEEARALSLGLVSLVPRPRAERFRPHSASSGDAFGAALASMPDDGEQFASTLVHEFQHNKLSAFMHLFTLYDDRAERDGPDGPGTRLYYAPWRDDPRPLGGLLQGVYAFFGVTGFWRRRDSALAQFEFALWRAQTAYALDAVSRAQGLTDLGRRLVAELSRRLEPWLDEPVDARARSAAELAVADHRATWRAHHLRPDPREARALATAFADGAPLPSPTHEGTLTPGTPVRGFDTRAALLRWSLAHPEGFDALRGDPGGTVSGARPEDIALVTGRTAEALSTCHARIVHGDGEPETWVGLGLAARAAGDPAGEVLLSRPQWAMALYAELAERADPLHVARALAGVDGTR